MAGEGKITLTDAQLRSMLDQAAAKAAANVGNIGVPGFAYASKTDRSEKMEQAKHLHDFLKAVSLQDRKAIEDLRKAAPEFYTKSAGDPFVEGTNGSGGYLVPEFWEAEIVKYRNSYGFYGRMARQIPLSTKTTHLPIGGSGAVTVSFPAENAAPTKTDAANFFSTLPLTPIKMAADFIQSEEFMSDTAVEIMSYLAEEIAQAFAKKEDYLGFAGDISGATDPFNGIIFTSGVNSVIAGNSAGSTKTAFSDITWKDIVRLMNKVEPDAQQGADLFVSQAVAQALMLDVDTTGRPILTNSAPMPLGPMGIFGYQTSYGPRMFIIPSGVLPATAATTTAAIYGNVGKWACIGRHGGLTQKTFTESYNSVDLAGKQLQAYVTTQRIATGVMQPSAFAILKTATS